MLDTICSATGNRRRCDRHRLQIQPSAEQIHNYILTRTMLYVRDAHHRDIPVSQIDLVATQKANEDAGVAFQLPGSN